MNEDLFKSLAEEEIPALVHNVAVIQAFEQASKTCSKIHQGTNTEKLRQDDEDCVSRLFGQMISAMKDVPDSCVETPTCQSSEGGSHRVRDSTFD